MKLHFSASRPICHDHANHACSADLDRRRIRPDNTPARSRRNRRDPLLRRGEQTATTGKYGLTQDDCRELHAFGIDQ